MEGNLKAIVASLEGIFAEKRKLEGNPMFQKWKHWMPISGGATGGTGGIRPPNSQKSAKIVKEKWHKISWVYL